MMYRMLDCFVPLPKLERTYTNVPDWVVSQLVDENKKKFSARCATCKSRAIQNFGAFIEKEIHGNLIFARLTVLDDVAQLLSEMWDTDQFKLVFCFAELIVINQATENWAPCIG